MQCADLVFRRMDRSTCGWTRGERTAEQVVNHLGERGACRCDLRIRRGKEVAENRQSHRPVTADTIYRTSCGCHISRGPAMNQAETQNSFRDANFSSSSNLRKPRTGRSEGAARSSAADSEARRTRGGDQFSLVGRSHRKGCLPRGRREEYFRVLTRKPVTASEEEQRL